VKTAKENRGYPFITFALPVLNEKQRIQHCLKSIFTQDYPKDKLEVLVIDGGSIDNTVELAKNFPVKVIFNKNRDPESGNSLGIRAARGSILVFFAADHELASESWLRKMIRPFLEEDQIFGVKCSWLTEKNDPIINRYCTYLQIADPLARYLDAETTKEVEERGDYRIIIATKEDPPVIGADLIWRKDVILRVGGYLPKFEETNFVSRVITHGYNRYAEVLDVGIYHSYVRNLQDFIKKRVKIGRKFSKRIKQKQATWVNKKGRGRFLKSLLLCITLIKPATESIHEYRKTRDIAWFLHPFMCFLTVLTYSFTLIASIIRR